MLHNQNQSQNFCSFLRKLKKIFYTEIIVITHKKQRKAHTKIKLRLNNNSFCVNFQEKLI